MYSSIVVPKVVEGFVSHHHALGVANYDLDELYSPDTDVWKSKVLDLGSPKYNPNSVYAFDRSRYQNHGTITGAIWRRQPNGLWYLGFNGSSDKITIPAHPSLLLGSGDFTLAFWLYLTTLTNAEYLLGTSSGTKDVYIFGTSGAIKIDLEGASTVISNTGLVEAGKYLRLIIVRSGDDCIIYKNGVLFQTVSNGFAGGNNTTSEDLILGYNS